MSHFRLVRTSLLLATLGLNVAPAILGMSAAHAADPAPAKPAEPPKNAVRPEIFKLIEPAKIKELMAAKDYTEVKSRIDQAAALPNLTPYESFVMDQMRSQLAQGSGDTPQLIKSLTAMIDSGQLPPDQKLNLVAAIANIYYSAKDFDNAIIWFNRYATEGGDPAVMRAQLVRCYFFKNDFATAKTEVMKDVATAETSGKSPTLDELSLLGNIGIKTKDTGLYLQAIELLTKYYPTEAYWQDLLNRTRGKNGYSPRFDLDVVRLKALAAPSKMEPEDYAELAEIALLGGFYTEAKVAMDKGYPGALPGGKDGAQLKVIRDKAIKGAADDAKNISSGEAPAAKSADGIGQVNLGYAYITMGQYDKGIELMKAGIAKGVKKNPEDAKLRLGYALAIAGKKDESIALLKTIQGADGRGDLARYWIIYQNAPAAVPATPAAAK